MNRRGPRRGRCLSCGRAVWLCAGTTQPRFLHHAPTNLQHCVCSLCALRNICDTAVFGTN